MLCWSSRVHRQRHYMTRGSNCCLYCNVGAALCKMLPQHCSCNEVKLLIWTEANTHTSKNSKSALKTGWWGSILWWLKRFFRQKFFELQNCAVAAINSRIQHSWFRFSLCSQTPSSRRNWWKSKCCASETHHGALRRWLEPCKTGTAIDLTFLSDMKSEKMEVQWVSDLMNIFCGNNTSKKS